MLSFAAIKSYENKIWRLILRLGFPLKLRLFALRKIGVKIGTGIYVGEGLTLSADLGTEKRLTIENRVAIAPNVNLILSAHPNDSRLSHLLADNQFLCKQGSITLNNDCWIGMGAIILPNITIGAFSVIGAGSIVTKDIPPYSVAVGCPAKVIRTIHRQKF